MAGSVAGPEGSESDPKVRSSIPCLEQNSKSKVSSMFVRLRFSFPAAASSKRRNFGVTRKLIEMVRSAVMTICIEDDLTARYNLKQEGSPVFDTSKRGVPGLSGL